MKFFTKIALNVFICSLVLFLVSLAIIESQNIDCNENLDCQQNLDNKLNPFYTFNALFGIGVLIGAILIIIVLFPKSNENNSSCQKCGKDYGFGFIYLPSKEWNVKETKVCKLCYKEIEKGSQSNTNEMRK